MSEGLDIRKRAISKSTHKYKHRDGSITKYPRYVLTLPKEFAEKHNLEKTGLWLVADQVWFGLPDEKSLMKVVGLLPEIKELISTKGLSKKDVQKILELNPEIRDYVMDEIESEEEAKPIV